MPDRNQQRRRNLTPGSWPLRTKVAAVLAAPVAALVVVASVGVAERVQVAREGAAIGGIADQAILVADLVDQLQTERSLVGLIGAGESDPARRTELEVQSGVTDAKAQEVQRSVGQSGTEIGRRFDSGVNAAFEFIAQVPDVRERAIEGRSVSDVGGMTVYTDAIEQLLAANDQVASITTDSRLSSQINAFTALAWYKELTAREAAVFYQVFTRNSWRTEYGAAAADAAAREVQLRDFRNSATDAQIALFEEQTNILAADTVRSYRDLALSKPAASTLDLDPGLWRTGSSKILSQLSNVDQSLAGDVQQAAEAQRQSAQRDAMLFALGALLIVALSVAVATVVARSIIVPLRRLTGAANHLREDLPQVVQRLQGSEGAAPAAAFERIDIDSEDEVGELAQAFNSVHDVAVEVATEQAALRASIADMVLNLARRNQSLLDRQLQYLDELEDRETDPDDLQHLFTLDHLATRMRRNAESLLVLAGADPTRRRRESVAVADVIRAAGSEVEDYARIDILTTTNLAVTGTAAASVAHLLAELLENATSFSPPGTRVTVTTEQAGEATRIVIADRGLGMSEEELAEANERLARPALIDVALSKRLGFSVVGRVADRFGIRVRLSHSEGGGVTATVVLPPSILCAPGSNEPKVPANGTRAAVDAGPETPPAPSTMDDALPPAPSSLAGLETLAPAPPEPAPGPGAKGAPGRPQRSGRGPAADAPPGPVAPVEPAPPAPPTRRPAPQAPAPEARQAPKEPPSQPRLPSRAPGRPAGPPAQPTPGQPAVQRQGPPRRPAGPPQGAPPARRPAPTPAPATASGGGEPELTAAGLPKRRRPAAASASAPRATAPAQPTRPAPAAMPERSPEQLRAMLSRFQQGTQTGRTRPAGTDLPFQPTEDAT